MGQLNIRIDDDLKKNFIDRAKAEGTTATDLLVGFMRQYLGLEAHQEPAIFQATEASYINRIDTRLAEIEVRIAALENQQSGELTA